MNALRPAAPFAILDHVCRRCLGRILSCDGGFVCATCGEFTGGAHENICGCGIGVDAPAGYRRLGFRCVANPAQSASNPSQIVISHAGGVAP